MAGEKHVAPAKDVKAFHCPYCGVFAYQIWRAGYWVAPGATPIPDLSTSACSHCGKIAIWVAEIMVSPVAGTAPPPNTDLPADISEDYEEARSIVARSPRGAAALLRLSIQKLCKHLGEKGKNPNDDIASLVKKGLPAGVQKALDTVRVTGNESVHPGTIDLRDNSELAGALFGLVNFIAEKMISEPKEIDAIYNSLPSEKLNAIAKRDAP
ncbi:MAG: DUF4145 domain-containing protein [Alphaproteobacteria bacterium]|nr:DUF4145 domain-containing protein [Alphaproteobacteria bacterium]MBL7098742.1 DUF4145 domain-containing protein [Alphaproteobacteria bacterium]